MRPAIRVAAALGLFARLGFGRLISPFHARTRILLLVR